LKQYVNFLIEEIQCEKKKLMLAGTDPEKRPKFLQSRNQHDSWFNNRGKYHLPAIRKLLADA
jgi:hypothetical protein